MKNYYLAAITLMVLSVSMIIVTDGRYVFIPCALLTVGVILFLIKRQKTINEGKEIQVSPKFFETRNFGKWGLVCLFVTIILSSPITMAVGNSMIAFGLWALGVALAIIGVVKDKNKEAALTVLAVTLFGLTVFWWISGLR